MKDATLGWRFLLFVLFVLARSWLMRVGYDGATFLKVKSRECADVWFELVNDCFRLGRVICGRLPQRLLRSSPAIRLSASPVAVVPPRPGIQCAEMKSGSERPVWFGPVVHSRPKANLGHLRKRTSPYASAISPLFFGTPAWEPLRPITLIPRHSATSRKQCPSVCSLQPTEAMDRPS
jgi:hypothetical protein